MAGIVCLTVVHVLAILLPPFLPVVTNLVDLQPLMNYLGVGFLLVSILASVIEIDIARESLRTEEERFAKLVQTAQEAVAILDNQCRLNFANLKFIETLGIPEPQILGHHLQEFISEQHLLERLQKTTEDDSGGFSRFECRLQLPQGGDLDMLASATALVDADSRFQGAFVMLMDVSALNEAKTALLESERNYREIFNSTNDAMIILNGEGRILDINTRTCNLFGIERDQALASSIDDYNSPSPSGSRLEATEWVRKAVEEGPQLFEWPVHNRSGQIFWTEVGLRASNVGGRQCVIAAVRDITERKQLEAQLRQAQKMEAIGQLAGGIAHDFNNLLQVINGYSDLVIDEEECSSPTRDALLEIRRAGESATRLVSQLLAFGRRQVLRREHLDINEVIDGLMNMLHRVIGEHIHVSIMPGPNVQPINADRGQLEQVLMNLCVNARDAMPDGGTLAIETADVVFDREFCHANSWAREGHFVLVSVSDSGHGIDSHTLSHIWEPFFTTKEVGKGTGLGLATVYGIVRQHDGMVNVYSEPAKGTVFKIYLPAYSSEPPAVAVSVDTDHRGAGELVLLAEDNEMVRNLTRHMLEQAGYKVITANDGMEAVRLLEDQGEEVCIAVMDLVMPGLGGRAVYERVKDQFPKLRFLFASGYSSGIVQTGLGPNDEFELIQKPFKRTEFLGRIRKLIEV
jgi:PAS domain S-box-containing protein